MENKVLKKIIIFVTVFMLVFSNCGYTLQVLAATDGITLFGFNLFGSGNIDFDVYFLDENGEKQTEKISNVNRQMTMVLEFTPKANGYLKSGTIKAVDNREGKANFKIDEVFLESDLNTENLTITTPIDERLLQSELTINSEENEVSTEIENTIVTETVTDGRINEFEELVDEDAALSEENLSFENSSSSVAKATILTDNEIKVENIIENTKVYVNISFQTGEKLNPEDLCKEISFNFEGNYITYSLEEIPVSTSKNVKVVWEYTKDVEVSSEYTKVSPFEIEGTKGTIVENTITVKRNIEDNCYLPVKETKIVLNLPTLDGKLPINLDVSAMKLKATKGEDVNQISFSNENWSYDSDNNTLTIIVDNNEGNFTYGEDIFIVTFRYDSYISESEVSLSTNGKVYVTEFSGKDNHEIIKELNKNEKVIVNVGELITYSLGTTETKIGKGKINANYNNEEEKYVSEFDTTVNVNILTNDVLSEFTLKDTKEFYIDKDGQEIETNDVKYQKVKFKYHEIEKFLSEGGTIEIKSNSGEMIYILNNDLIKSDEDAEISISGDVRGIEISFKNITVNGSISIEFIKSIGKSEYEKAVFASVKKLESRMNGIVKYSEDSEGTNLAQIKTEKEFEESKTEAEITMNKVGLSTTELNENVEFKIELNNDKENSDLYINPIFEISLPKYVSNIDLKAVNILYEAGLSLGNSTIYRAEDGTLRMRIEIKGTQREFSEGTLTNGTNIIVNANIELDKFTPRKDEQIKLYYINEGVTNYVSQTRWTMDVNVPEGILKTTNGFDSYVFKLNAPSGFVTVNEIQNYDGENSTVSSLKQGTEIREIEMGQGAQVAKMNLFAINNTENPSTDVMFLGRIPAKGVTEVKTGEILETTIDTIMLSKITENEENPLSAKVYYSENPNADKNLNDSANGWTEEIYSLEGVKSFLIVPDNKVEPGDMFQYSYEFLIPENLPFEAKIYGSFGVFYNNHSNIAVTYESSSADLVGIVTKSGPKVETTLSVNVGDGAEVPEASFLDYTLTVVNSGSVTAEGIKVTNLIPEGTTLYTERLIEGKLYYGWFSTDETELEWEIEKLEEGEVREFTYTVKIDNNAENNIIQNKATVKVDNLELEIESNETKNKVTKSNFDINVFSRVHNNLSTGNNFILGATIQNISGEDLNNVTLEYKMPEELEYTSYQANFMNESLEESNFIGEFDSDTKIFTLQIDNWKKDEILELKLESIVIRGNANKVPNIISVTMEEKIESSKPLEMLFRGPKLEAIQTCSTTEQSVKEGEKVEFIFSINNTGTESAKNTKLYSEVSKNLEDVTIDLSGSETDSLSLSENYELDSKIYSIPMDECLNITISGTVKDVEDDTQTISSKMLISNPYTKEITTNEIILQILNDPDRVKENDKIISDNNYDDSDDDNTIILPDYSDEENNIEEDNNSDNANISNSEVQNSTQDSSNSNNSQDVANIQQDEQQVTQKHNISGKIWLDANKNGIFEENELGISGIQMQLQKDNMSIKATVSSGDGSYIFRDVEPGKYVVLYSYDNNLYTPTVYKNTENGEEKVSYARDLDDGNAITDTITVDEDVFNINLGLKEKDKFDFTISKNMILAKVTTNEKITEHPYEHLDLAKLEISAKDLAKSTVELHYEIIVKNEGNVAGNVMQVADYLPKDTILDTAQSVNWYLGSDGNAYNDSLAQLSIAPGETRILNLVLIRKMTEENTGVLANKVSITKIEGSTDSMVENLENNDATQELLISVRTGYTAPIIINLIIVATGIVIVYLEKSKKIQINFKKLSIKRIYK